MERGQVMRILLGQIGTTTKAIGSDHALRDLPWRPEQGDDRRAFLWGLGWPRRRADELGGMSTRSTGS
eukprot:4385226-Pyramimonas_sp.AAC.1